MADRDPVLLPLTSARLESATSSATLSAWSITQNTLAVTTGTSEGYDGTVRWYDPVTARWLSNDPIGISGGLNQYVFCGNNPVMFVDPFGLTFQIELGGQATAGAGLFVHGELNVGLEFSLRDWVRVYVRAQGAGMGGWFAVAQAGPQAIVGWGAAPYTTGYNEFRTIHAEEGAGYGGFVGLSQDAAYTENCGVSFSGGFGLRGGAGIGVYGAEGIGQNVVGAFWSLREIAEAVWRQFSGVASP